MSPRTITAAHAWCWAAHLAHVEADAIAYAWPREPDREDRASGLMDAADAFMGRVHELTDGAASRAWEEAMRLWDWSPAKD